jgi:hypothetical protein
MNECSDEISVQDANIHAKTVEGDRVSSGEFETPFISRDMPRRTVYLYLYYTA